MTASKTAAKEIDTSISSNVLHNYIIDRRVGKGAYGIVWRAYKRNTNQPVALKKIYDAFRNTEDAQRTFREVTYLKAFKGHPNIIQLLNIHRATNSSDLYLVFEYMNIDLHNYITSGNKLDNNQVRYIIYQILKALKFIHSGNVVHRDLKPSNILLNFNCDCKIADFGLARSLGESRLGTRNPLTDYVATRWYRAPEILLGSKRYSQLVDLWSLGCVLAEMVTGTPIFPGDSTINQLELIIAAVAHDDKEVEALGRLGVCRPRIAKGLPLKDRLRSGSCECIDLVSRMLRLDPALRISAQQALRHPFVCSFRSRRGEPVLGRTVQAAISDNNRLTVQDYRAALYSYEERKPRTFLPSNLPGLNRFSKSRNKNSFNKKLFSSEPENTGFKARMYESTRYPPLSNKTCFRRNFQSKVSIRS